MQKLTEKAALYLAFLALLFTASGCAAHVPSMAKPAASTIPVTDISYRYIHGIFPEIEVTSDIQYSEAKNIQGEMNALKLDLYEPKGDTLDHRPAVIFVHGGSFVAGDKAEGIEQELAVLLAHKGYVTLCINYRLRATPSTDWKGTFRDAEDDAYAAYTWLVQNKDLYRIDADHIAFAGHSAGSDIVTDLCYSSWAGKPIPKDGVFAVVSLSGPETIFASPQAADPFDIIIQGSADEVIPVTKSEHLSSMMDAVGTPHLLTIIPNCKHVLTPAIDEVEDVVASGLYKAMTGKESGIEIRRYADELK